MTAVESDQGTTSAAVLKVRDPATGHLLDTLPVDGPEAVHATLARAREAFPGWSDTPVEERARALFDIAAAVRANAAEIARIVSREGGQIIAEAEIEVETAALTFEFYAGVARHYGGPAIPSTSATTENIVRKDPIGVVAAIVPWNYPLTLWAWKAAPAIAGGSVVVSKPSPETPLSILRVQELMTSSGLPDGVHQVVVGGAETGHALISDPLVDGIAFTGSVAAGKEILRTAAENLTTICTLELSGHDPFIVADDVDVPLAAELVAFNSFLHTGQICVATERVYVAEAIFDEFVENIVKQARVIRLGDPLDYGTDMGPVMNDRQMAHLEAYVAKAVALGATVHTGGKKSPEHGELFFEPTVITGLTHTQITDMGEIFGPIVPIVPVSSFDEAIRLANDSLMGLGSCVVTGNLERAMQASRQLRSGSVWINSGTNDAFGGPFGGFRQSGQGRELGIEGYEAFLQSKHVTIAHKLEPSPYWFGRRHD
ncbi:aldehyde dehydrogenase family protein [Streptomyces cellulosae]|uniref:aldehyde dehydrogenase family protein n=1 Tax=Streptomyces cellulosae TaxID=1968 RepID=UPI0005658AE2|nr:aldehyde dehydrogenase family protein [Streptomyces cellulosae]